MPEIIIESSKYLLDSSRDYSIYVCENRAIPRITDGLKDAQRKAIWVTRNKAEKIKTIALAGELISSNLYLHGDQSAAGAISMLAAPFCNNVTYYAGTGAFGTRVAPVEGIGAPRYTYVKRNKAVQEIMLQDLDVVPLKDNYDGSVKEPETFLPLIPTVLLNGVSGIAVGWSTEILPRKLDDLIDSCINILDGKKIKRLIPTYSYLNCKATHIEDNTWEFAGIVEIENTSTAKVIELPPDLTLDKFISKLNVLEEEGKIRGYVDRSTKNINVTVKFKLGAIKDWSEDKVIDYLKLRSKKIERCVVIDWNGKSIKQYNTAEEIVEKFVPWRLGYHKKRYEKKLSDTLYELKYWEGMKECFNKNLPEKLSIAKDKSSVEKEINTITKSIGLDSKQVDKIASLPSYRWAKDSYKQVIEKIKELNLNIKEYNTILKDPQRIKTIYREELVNLKTLKLG